MKQITIALALIIILLLFCSGVHAQTIQLHFPHFADHSYDWKIFQGKKQITVRSGKIASDGRVTLVMPEAYQDYRGMTRWMLKNGGGLDMIYMGKGFSVECQSEHPSDKNIIYTGNPENDYLIDQHNRQQVILDKLGAVNHFLQVYTHTEDLYQAISKEQVHMRQQFEQAQAERADSPLYAARFGEIVDFTKGVADRVYVNPADHTGYFNDFVTHTHGGQIWPFNYFVYLQQPYLKGFYDYNGTKLYVNQGTGCWGPPVRLGSKNEITQIILDA